MKKNISKILTVLTLSSCIAIPHTLVNASEIEDTTTEEVSEDIITEEVSEDITTEEVSEDIITEEVSEDITTEEVSEDTTTEEVSEDTTIEEVSDDTTTEEVSEDNILTVELVNIENEEFFPVRKVAEALGYTVEWNGNTKSIILSKLPIYVTFSIGVDGYTFAKTAPMSLGKAPILIDGVSYAPISLIEIIDVNSEVSLDENILNINKTDEISEEVIIINEDDIIEESSEEVIIVNEDDIIEESSEEVELTEVEILEIDSENSSILVNDANLGEVLIKLSDDTQISISSELEVGQTIYVVYGDTMTLSIPAINNALAISDTLE